MAGQRPLESPMEVRILLPQPGLGFVSVSLSRFRVF
jgi:hypothetical protein